MLCDGCQQDRSQIMHYKDQQLCKACFQKAYEEEMRNRKSRAKEDADPQVGS
jgi:predicted amidophosphoribosyltransferase